jgi:glutamate--cysteine ligase
LEQYGYMLLTQGCDPLDQACEVPLIPKYRYRHMDAHFKGTGWAGACMMRCSASTQVSIDFADEADAVCKFRVANALGPLLYFISDNTPASELNCACSGNSEPVARMARSVIWDNVDADRSLIAPGTFDDGFGFVSYGRALLRAPAIFSPEPYPAGTYTAAAPVSEVFGSEPLDTEKVEHILSMFFYDVRFKTYIEIRVADALPIEYALAYTALIEGVFYNHEAVEELSRDFAGLDAQAVAEAKELVRAGGYDAVIYGASVTSWLDRLVAYAAASLDALDLPYLEPLAQLVAGRRTLIG